MLKKLVFGTGGAPLSTVGEGSVKGVARIRELGLSCMEVEWVQGNPSAPGSKTLLDIKKESEKDPKVIISCHSSYYINLAGEQDVIDASRERIRKAAASLASAGGRNVVFHPGFYKDRTPEETHKIVIENMQMIVAQLEAEKVAGYTLRPETTGKPTQHGSIDETIGLCLEVPNTLPCIDFAHLHARSGGKFNTKKEFAQVLEKLGKLGDKGLKDMHIHLSGIEYSDKGERKHLKLLESDMNYKDLFKTLKEFGACGMVICESPVLEEDALIMQEYYESL